MGLFGSDSDGESAEETVTVERERTAEFTRHTATIEYQDGTAEEVVFDSMNRGDNGVTFYDYTGAYLSDGLGFTRQRFDKEAFLFVPYTSLKNLETTEREDHSLTYTVEEQIPEREA